jgi:hypothetical protein
MECLQMTPVLMPIWAAPLISCRYLHKIRAYYPCRDSIPGALDLAIKACEDQICIAKQSARQFIKEGGLPEHTGYKQLCIIREKQGNYNEVIRLSTEAKEAGWPGDWDKRIEKAKKKLEQGEINNHAAEPRGMLFLQGICIRV